MTVPWDPAFAQRSAMFAPLRTIAQDLPAAGWPDCAVLNALAAAQPQPPRNARGQVLRFIPQLPRQLSFDEKFEPRTYLHGEVQMRSHNWHDLLNALVWLAFPRAKAAINGRHYAALRSQQDSAAANRGPVQDALTLFDEGGVIVAAGAPALAGLLRRHEWKTLFWQRRAELPQAMGFFLFGHALYEKALQPFHGITARSLILDVEPAFFDHDAGRQRHELDRRLSALVADADYFRSTREQTPLPLLGVPGWHAGNARADYYDDTAYFRPLRPAS